jgi:hypothetical protein
MFNGPQMSEPTLMRLQRSDISWCRFVLQIIYSHRRLTLRIYYVEESVTFSPKCCFCKGYRCMEKS